MTAKPHANHHLLVRLAALEEKVKTEFDLLHAKVEEYGLLCENRHFNALVTDQDNVSAYQQRIAELEKENNNLKQQVESGQRMYRHLEERLIRLERKVEETKEPVVDANIAHNNTETEVNVTNTTVTENVATNVEQLFKFIRNGREAEVKSIIASGVDVSVPDHQGRTPLHIAAEEGYRAVCDYLLDKGANVNVKNKWGFTPLHHTTVSRKFRELVNKTHKMSNSSNFILSPSK